MTSQEGEVPNNPPEGDPLVDLDDAQGIDLDEAEGELRPEGSCQSPDLPRVRALTRPSRGLILKPSAPVPKNDPPPKLIDAFEALELSSEERIGICGSKGFPPNVMEYIRSKLTEEWTTGELQVELSIQADALTAELLEEAERDNQKRQREKSAAEKEEDKRKSREEEDVARAKKNADGETKDKKAENRNKKTEKREKKADDREKKFDDRQKMEEQERRKEEEKACQEEEKKKKKEEEQKKEEEKKVKEEEQKKIKDEKDEDKKKKNDEQKKVKEKKDQETRQKKEADKKAKEEKDQEKAAKRGEGKKKKDEEKEKKSEEKVKKEEENKKKKEAAETTKASFTHAAIPVEAVIPSEDSFVSASRKKITVDHKLSDAKNPIPTLDTRPCFKPWRLKVIVMKATNLLASDGIDVRSGRFSASSDPMVFVELDGCLARTAVRRNTLNPVWLNEKGRKIGDCDAAKEGESDDDDDRNDGGDSTFELYALTRQGRACRLVVFDWDEDGGHDPLGDAAVNLTDLPIGAGTTRTVALSGLHKTGCPCSGTLTLQLLLEPNFATDPSHTFLPQKSVAAATILRASSFPAQIGLYRLLFVPSPTQQQPYSLQGNLATVSNSLDAQGGRIDERAALKRAVTTLVAVGVKDSEWLGELLLGDVTEGLEKKLDDVFERAVLLYDGNDAADTAKTGAGIEASAITSGGEDTSTRSVRECALANRLERMTLEATLAGLRELGEHCERALKLLKLCAPHAGPLKVQALATTIFNAHVARAVGELARWLFAAAESSQEGGGGTGGSCYEGPLAAAALSQSGPLSTLSSPSSPDNAPPSSATRRLSKILRRSSLLSASVGTKDGKAGKIKRRPSIATSALMALKMSARTARPREIASGGSSAGATPLGTVVPAILKFLMGSGDLVLGLDTLPSSVPLDTAGEGRGDEIRGYVGALHAALASLPPQGLGQGGLFASSLRETFGPGDVLGSGTIHLSTAVQRPNLSGASSSSSSSSSGAAVGNRGTVVASKEGAGGGLSGRLGEVLDLSARVCDEVNFRGGPRGHLHMLLAKVAAPYTPPPGLPTLLDLFHIKHHVNAGKMATVGLDAINTSLRFVLNGVGGVMSSGGSNQGSDSMNDSGGGGGGGGDSSAGRVVVGPEGGGAMVQILGTKGWHRLLYSLSGRKTLPWVTDALAILNGYFDSAKKYFTPPKQPTKSRLKQRFDAAAGIIAGGGENEDDDEDDDDDEVLASWAVYRCLMPSVYSVAAHALDSMLASMLASLALLRAFQAREHVDSLRAHAQLVKAAAAAAEVESPFSGLSSLVMGGAERMTSIGHSKRNHKASAAVSPNAYLLVKAKRLDVEARAAEKRWLGVLESAKSGGGGGKTGLFVSAKAVSAIPHIGLERGFWSLPGSLPLAEAALKSISSPSAGDELAGNFSNNQSGATEGVGASSVDGGMADGFKGLDCIAAVPSEEAVACVDVLVALSMDASRAKVSISTLFADPYLGDDKGGGVGGDISGGRDNALLGPLRDRLETKLEAISVGAAHQLAMLVSQGIRFSSGTGGSGAEGALLDLNPPPEHSDGSELDATPSESLSSAATRLSKHTKKQDQLQQPLVLASAMAEDALGVLSWTLPEIQKKLLGEPSGGRGGTSSPLGTRSLSSFSGDEPDSVTYESASEQDKEDAEFVHRKVKLFVVESLCFGVVGFVLRSAAAWQPFDHENIHSKGHDHHFSLFSHHKKISQEGRLSAASSGSDTTLRSKPHFAAVSSALEMLSKELLRDDDDDDDDDVDDKKSSSCKSEGAAGDSTGAVDWSTAALGRGPWCTRLQWLVDIGHILCTDTGSLVACHMKLCDSEGLDPSGPMLDLTILLCLRARRDDPAFLGDMFGPMLLGAAQLNASQASQSAARVRCGGDDPAPLGLAGIVAALSDTFNAKTAVMEVLAAVPNLLEVYEATAVDVTSSDKFAEGVDSGCTEEEGVSGNGRNRRRKKKRYVLEVEVVKAMQLHNTPEADEEHRTCSTFVRATLVRNHIASGVPTATLAAAVASTVPALAAPPVPSLVALTTTTDAAGTARGGGESCYGSAAGSGAATGVVGQSQEWFETCESKHNLNPQWRDQCSRQAMAAQSSACLSVANAGKGEGLPACLEDSSLSEPGRSSWWGTFEVGNRPGCFFGLALRCEVLSRQPNGKPPRSLGFTDMQLLEWDPSSCSREDREAWFPLQAPGMTVATNQHFYSIQTDTGTKTSPSSLSGEGGSGVGKGVENSNSHHHSKYLGAVALRIRRRDRGPQREGQKEGGKLPQARLDCYEHPSPGEAALNNQQAPFQALQPLVQSSLRRPSLPPDNGVGIGSANRRGSILGIGGGDNAENDNNNNNNNNDKVGVDASTGSSAKGKEGNGHNPSGSGNLNGTRDSEESLDDDNFSSLLKDVDSLIAGDDAPASHAGAHEKGSTSSSPEKGVGEKEESATGGGGGGGESSKTQTSSAAESEEALVVQHLSAELAATREALHEARAEAAEQAAKCGEAIAQLEQLRRDLAEDRGQGGENKKGDGACGPSLSPMHGIRKSVAKATGVHGFFSGKNRQGAPRT